MAKGGSSGVLFVHGLTGIPQEFNFLIKPFQESAYTVSAPLLPGHGTRAENLNGIRWTQHLEFIRSKYDELRAECELVTIVGQSYGALLALDLAVEQKEISCLAVISPPLGYSRGIYWKMAWGRLLGRNKPTPGSAIYDPIGQRDHWHYHFAPCYNLYELLILSARVRKRLDLVRTPTLVIRGRHDDEIPKNAHEIALNGLTNAKTKVLICPSSGHIVSLDPDRDEVATNIIDFSSKCGVR